MSDDDLFGPEHVQAYRDTDIIFAEGNGRYVVVASKGGDPVVVLERV